MNNLGIDVQAWIWVVEAALITGLSVWITYDILRYWNRMGKFEDSVMWKTTQTIITVGIKGIVLVLLIFALFVFFGQGKAPNGLPASEDSHRKMVKARPDPTPESAIREEAKAARDPYLNAVDNDASAARTEADAYLKKALEGSKTK